MAKRYNFKGLMIASIRKLFLYSPLRKEALARAKKIKNYKCANCGRMFDRKLVTVDHIEPVVNPEQGFPTVIRFHKEIDDWNTYIAKMFCSLDNLQVLCKNKCHKEKTAKERKVAAKRRKNATKRNLGA